jgi:hypothetical protein
MLPELFALGFIGSAIYGGYRLTRAAGSRALAAVQRHQTRRLTDQALRRVPQPTYSPAVQQAARDMQLALIQVREAPDFRRAASYALQAREVPLSFRQRQYRRFRSLLVSRFTALLQTGVSVDALMAGLTQLVSALGLAEFEADYIRLEAESQVSRREPMRRDFGQQLREAQSNYRDRVRVLEEMSDLDEEIREQLVEQERLKFQERMRELSTREETGHAH